jgi:Fic-DOC domain mobile mystery protein B
MLGETWTWAGTFRRSGKNIGVQWPAIPQTLSDTLENAAHWLKKGTFSVDEAVARFHHRMVWVHPFPNGNGRHGHLMADVLLWNLGLEPFTWGRGNLIEAGAVRDRYLAALKQADHGDIAPLALFVRA